jgi:hypothetical protein
LQSLVADMQELAEQLDRSEAQSASNAVRTVTLSLSSSSAIRDLVFSFSCTKFRYCFSVSVITTSACNNGWPIWVICTVQPPLSYETHWLSMKFVRTGLV